MVKKIKNQLNEMKVSPEFIKNLCESYEVGKYEDHELINCYCENELGGFTACFNLCGDCYCEDFENLTAVYLYLCSNLEITEIREIEKLIELDFSYQIKDNLKLRKSNDLLKEHNIQLGDRCVFLEQANQGLQEEKENLQDIIHNIQDYCKLRIIECVDIAYLVSNNWIMCCFDKHNLNDIHSLEDLKEVLKYES